MGGRTANQCGFFQLKLLYFLIYSGMGVLLPYLPVFFESLHFTKSQIGVLSMLPNMGNILFAPICSIIGDMFNAHYELMFLSLLVSTLLTVIMPYVQAFYSMVAIVLFFSFARAPLSPQIDALVMSILPDHSLYGDMRLWGAVSFGILSFVGGIMTTMNPKDEASSFRVLFFTYALFYVFSGFVLLYLLNSKVQDHIAHHYRQVFSSSDNSSENAEKKESSHSDNSKSDSLQNGSKQTEDTLSALYGVFSRHPELFSFAVVVFLSGLGSGVIDSFLFLRLTQLGGSGYVLGVSRFIMCMAEIPMFSWSGALLKRYGTWRMLAFTQCAFVLRFAYYASLTSPWFVLPCEVLHGVTFATLWNVSCAYASELSPESCHSTMQTLLEGLHWGLGSGVGALVGGVVYDFYGPVFLFEACGFLSFLALILSIVTYFLVKDDTIRGSDRENETNTKYDLLNSQSDHGLVLQSVRRSNEDEDLDEEEVEVVV